MQDQLLPLHIGRALQEDEPAWQHRSTIFSYCWYNCCHNLLRKFFITCSPF